MFPYPHLIMFFAMIAVHFGIMLPTMIEKAEHYYVSLNQFYMATLMGLCMILIEGAMHPMPVIAWISTIAAIVFVIICIRLQIGVSDSQYLRDMIPHHSMAIVTSRAKRDKEEVKEIASKIEYVQKAEIERMIRMI